MYLAVGGGAEIVVYAEAGFLNPKRFFEKVRPDNVSWPVLELTRLASRSGHRMAVCYDCFSETRFIVNVLEVSPERRIGFSLRLIKGR